MKIKNGLLAVAIGLTINTAHADLYISPSYFEEKKPSSYSDQVVDKLKSVSDESLDQETKLAMELKPVPLMPISESKIDGKAPKTPEKGVSLGKDIPYEMALASLSVPVEYDIRVDSPVAGARWSWNSAPDWRSALTNIAETNDVEITINDKEKKIGISYEVKVADALANVEVYYWDLFADRTLSENFEIWAEKAGWSLSWKSIYDYPVTHDARIMGTIKNAFTEVLEPLSKTSKPLSIVFHKGNKVIEVVDGGYKKESK